jgi:AraC-like DNA-binding protein
MKIADINPYVRYADNRILIPWPFFVYSPDCRLLYLQSGNIKFYFGDNSYDIEEGSLLLWQPGQRYRFERIGDNKIILLNYDFTQEHSDKIDSLSVMREENFNPSLIIGPCHFDDCPELSSLVIRTGMHHLEDDLKMIVREIRERKRLFRETSSAILKRVICEVARGSFADSSQGNTVERVISYIKENFRHQITNKDIAESVNYHEYYVNKLIQRQTGMTLHRYLTSYRLRVAAKLLVTTEFSVSEISEQCGFTSAAYFISAFGRLYKETPGEYRNRRGGLI